MHRQTLSKHGHGSLLKEARASWHHAFLLNHSKGPCLLYQVSSDCLSLSMMFWPAGERIRLQPTIPKQDCRLILKCEFARRPPPQEKKQKPKKKNEKASTCKRKGVDLDHANLRRVPVFARPSANFYPAQPRQPSQWLLPWGRGCLTPPSCTT